SLDLHDDGCDQRRRYARANRLRRRGRSVRRAEPVPEEASAGGGTRDVAEVRPRAQSRGARAVQRDGGAVRDAGGSRAMAGARSAVGGGWLELSVTSYSVIASVAKQSRIPPRKDP